MIYTKGGIDMDQATIDLIVVILAGVLFSFIVTRLTNKFVFKKFSHKQASIYSFFVVVLIATASFIYNGEWYYFPGAVLCLIYDLARVPEDTKQTKLNM
jgi:hypothetical protein